VTRKNSSTRALSGYAAYSTEFDPVGSLSLSFPEAQQLRRYDRSTFVYTVSRYFLQFFVAIVTAVVSGIDPGRCVSSARGAKVRSSLVVIDLVVVSFISPRSVVSLVFFTRVRERHSVYSAFTDRIVMVAAERQANSNGAGFSGRLKLVGDDMRN
jgi:hypothetical protein